MAFDKSKHPMKGIPGKGNRFVKKEDGGEETSEKNKTASESSVEVAGAKKAQELVRKHEQQTGKTVEQEIAQKAKEHVPPALGFANKERRETYHHRTHAREMGYKNQKEYEQGGVDFFNSDRGKLYYSLKRKRFYRYDEKTGELAVSSNGVLHTYMRQPQKKFAEMIKQEKLYE